MKIKGKTLSQLDTTLWFITLVLFVCSIALNQVNKEEVIKSNREMSKKIQEGIDSNTQLIAIYGYIKGSSQ